MKMALLNLYLDPVNILEESQMDMLMKKFLPLMVKEDLEKHQLIEVGINHLNKP